MSEIEITHKRAVPSDGTKGTCCRTERFAQLSDVLRLFADQRIWYTKEFCLLSRRELIVDSSKDATMPLKQTDRDNILRYCDRDVPDERIVSGFFDFVQEEGLRSALVREYIAARYIYKLQEALQVSDDKLAAHAKFQIVQFAAIYEALIVHVLWAYFAESPEVKAIEYYTALRKIAQFPANLVVQTNLGLEVHLCIEAEIKNTRHSIKFDDKVDAAVKIGFIDPALGEEVKEIFKIRNGVHIENAVKNEIEYELSQSQLAYWRIKPFTTGIRDFLTTGKLSEAARPKANQEVRAP